MKDPVKMKENEVAEVRMLQTKFQEKLQQFGLLYVEKMAVENAVREITEKETKLQDEWNNLKKMESELIDKFLKTYGEGALDIQNGSFIPDVKPPPTP